MVIQVCTKVHDKAYFNVLFGSEYENGSFPTVTQLNMKFSTEKKKKEKKNQAHVELTLSRITVLVVNESDANQCFRLPNHIANQNLVYAVIMVIVTLHSASMSLHGP